MSFLMGYINLFCAGFWETLTLLVTLTSFPERSLKAKKYLRFQLNPFRLTKSQLLVKPNFNEIRTCSYFECTATIFIISTSGKTIGVFYETVYYITFPISV